MKKFISFNDFINNKYDNFDFDYIFIGDLCLCSFVKYIFIPSINGEICGEPFIVDYEDSFKFNDLYYFDEYTVYAIQLLDNYVVEVVNFKK